MLFGKKEFSEVFKVGDVIESGAGPNRKDAARLKVLAIEEQFFRYQSVLSASKNRMNYSYLRMLLDSYEELNPKSIQKSVNVVLKKAGFNPNYSTENYSYSFAKAFHDFHERMTDKLFISQGESSVPISSQSEDFDYAEGRRVAVLVERIERDPKARLKCIEHYGAWCRVCRFDFQKTYGSIGQGFIHVHHHRVKLSQTQGVHHPDPIRDLIPLCPNCHAMVHTNKEMLSVQELQKLLEAARGRS